LSYRGVVVSYEAIRQWCREFGQRYADGLRRRRSRPGDKWHLDEVVISINGRHQYLWRAVDQRGNVLDIFVQSCRDAKAAECWTALRVSTCEWISDIGGEDGPRVGDVGL
jgi:putative transposase